MEVYTFNKNISAKYNSFDNWINYIGWRCNNFLDSIFGASLFGRKSIYNENPLTKEDRLIFTNNLNHNLISLFDVVYIPRGIKFIRKQGLSLEKII